MLMIAISQTRWKRWGIVRFWERFLGNGDESDNLDILIAQLGTMGTRRTINASNKLKQMDRTGKLPPSSIPRLIEALREPQSGHTNGRANVRGGIATTLGNMGEVAIPFLLELICDPDPDMRAAAAQAFGCMPDLAEQHIQRLLNSPNGYCKSGAMAAVAAKMIVPVEDRLS